MATPRERAAADWPTEPERRYASLQARSPTDATSTPPAHAVETRTAGEVHYLAASDPAGEPVLLLHGITEPAATWLLMMDALADRYRLLAPDLPGEGLSTKPGSRGRDLRTFIVTYLVELLDVLGVDRPHVVAHSLGGWQAFPFVLDRDRLDRLCLVGRRSESHGTSRSCPGS